MSIQQIQTKNILELIAQSFLVNGSNPQLTQMYMHLSSYFARNPAGRPVTFDVDLFRQDIKSDPEFMNDFMAYAIVNIDTLYESCQQQVDQVLMLNTILRTHLDRLKTRRDILSSKLDDYLLGIYNSDGYFHSISDGFYDTNLIDFSFTSATIDTDADMVSLSPISSQSQIVSSDKIGDPQVTITDKDNNTLSFTTKMPFKNALDGMSNTAWFVEVRTSAQGPITAVVNIPINNGSSDNKITEINLTPYGVTEIQCGINAVYSPQNIQNNYTKPFANKVITSANRMKFIGDQVEDITSSIQLQLTKVGPDYIQRENNNTTTNIFVFGFKEILMAEQYYDTFGTLVSTPLSIPSDLQNDMLIDAVSIVSDSHVPTNTSLTYYVAADNPTAESLSDFNWREIVPISNLNPSANNVVHFGGSIPTSNYIRLTKRQSTDLLLYPLNDTDPDLAKRNPSPTFFPSIDVYRLTEFKESFLKDTLTLEEGINTTRIYYTELDDNAITDGFSFWSNIFQDSSLYTTTYGEIDSGHEFFYGADVGESHKSIYAETYLDADKEFPVILKECRKSDVNSQSWNIRVFLNGNEVANMPVGVNKITVPWKFKQGKNHIVVMANIPAGTVSITDPYIGTFNIMADGQITDYGSIKLDDWVFVDNYKFLNNQVNDASSFTIYNDQIISRKQPTNNFRISYNKSTQDAPEAIRFKADFTRDSQYAMATPLLDGYRIRFAYKT